MVFVQDEFRKVIAQLMICTSACIEKFCADRKTIFVFKNASERLDLLTVSQRSSLSRRNRPLVLCPSIPHAQAPIGARGRRPLHVRASAPAPASPQGNVLEAWRWTHLRRQSLSRRESRPGHDQIRGRQEISAGCPLEASRSHSREWVSGTPCWVHQLSAQAGLSAFDARVAKSTESSLPMAF